MEADAEAAAAADASADAEALAFLAFFAFFGLADASAEAAAGAEADAEAAAGAEAEADAEAAKAEAANRLATKAAMIFFILKSFVWVKFGILCESCALNEAGFNLVDSVSQKKSKKCKKTLHFSRHENFTKSDPGL